MKSIIFISLALSVFENPVQNDQKWANFKEKFDKNYLNKNEEVKRYNTFMENDKMINMHNEKYSQGEVTYKMGHNQFSDMTKEELSRIYRHPISTSSVNKNNLRRKFSLRPANSTLPKVEGDSLSYQQYCMAPLNQGQCGSCWAFASAAQVEAQLKIKDYNFNTYISPQYILDCSSAGSCDGGDPGHALKFLRWNGLKSLYDYPYVTHDQVCNTNVPLMPQKINYAYAEWIRGNEDDMKNYLTSVGPVVIAMYVSDSFYSYNNGIYSDSSCPSNCDDLNHAMLLIGYGTDSSYGDYWLLKNSWGTNWGESGYIRMARNAGNNCNVACMIFFAKV